MTSIADFTWVSDTDEVMRRFQDVMCDMVDEGVSPDTISKALARLGFGISDRT